MQRNLTKGPITVNLLFFALPLMFGNLLQQLYNVADTWVVGRYLGADALAAVGSSYTLMTFLTSILLGLCMGSGAAISMLYGSGEKKKMRQSIFMAFCLIGAIALVINILVYLGMDGILWILRVPASIKGLMKDYLWVIFLGILATFLYNYFANLLRAIGNSMVPLLFLAVSSVLNIILDLLFVLKFHWGVGGAAGATVFSQYVSGIGICIYAYAKEEGLEIREPLCLEGKEALLWASVDGLREPEEKVMVYGLEEIPDCLDGEKSVSKGIYKEKPVIMVRIVHLQELFSKMKIPSECEIHCSFAVIDPILHKNSRIWKLSSSKGEESLSMSETEDSQGVLSIAALTEILFGYKTPEEIRAEESVILTEELEEELRKLQNFCPIFLNEIV